MLAAARRLLVALLMVGGLVVLGAVPAQACTCAATGAPTAVPSAAPSAVPTSSPTNAAAASASASAAESALAQRIKAADAVFTGTVVQGPATGAGTVITNTVQVDRVYKGEIADPEQVVHTTPRTQAACGLGELTVGTRYLFIVQADATEAGVWADQGCSGTRVADAALITQVRGVLGAGQPTTPQVQPPAAVLTPADLDEPTSLSRMAAPGLALVLIGFLGLVLVRRVNSRRG